jgi:hypothetical protein
VDTSVIGGCFDAEFVTWSDALMRDFRAKRLVPVLSDVTAAEIAAAPAAVRVLHHELLALGRGVLPVTPAVLALVAAYEARKILPKTFAADMTHIALATIAEVDAIGYRALSILSPREVLGGRVKTGHFVDGQNRPFVRP